MGASSEGEFKVYGNWYVVSPGRSGSSFFGGVLKAAGLNGGHKIAVASPARGDFKAYEKNEFLPCRNVQKKITCREMDNELGVGPIEIRSSDLKKAKAALAELEKPRFLKIPVQSVKFVPLWCHQLGMDPVGIIRHPAEVVDSFVNRANKCPKVVENYVCEFYELMSDLYEKNPYPIFVYDKNFSVTHVNEVLNIHSTATFDTNYAQAKARPVSRETLNAWSRVKEMATENGT